MTDTSLFTTEQPHYDSIEELYAQGATCDTYRVKLYGKLHFLKRLKPQHAGDIRYREAMRKEFETGYRLEHPRLVRYIQMGGDSILMEYVDGETLTQRLAAHPDYFADKKNTDKLVSQLLDAVGYLHSQQVLHLDLKPDNILLTRIGSDLKLVDLGGCYTDTFADTTGHTDRYAAPEQKAGGSIDVRTDIYALGRILMELPHLPGIYSKVAARCTADTPEDRYPSVEAVVADLRRRRTTRRCITAAAVAATIVLPAALLLWPRADVFPAATPTPAEEQATLKPESIAVRDTTHAESIAAGTPPKPIEQQAASQPPQATASPAADPLVSLRSDIKRLIRPHFDATVGALPDSVMPSSQEWADGCDLLLPLLLQDLRSLISSHPALPEETVTKEYNDYVDALMTAKMNRAFLINNYQP